MGIAKPARIVVGIKHATNRSTSVKSENSMDPTDHTELCDFNGTLPYQLATASFQDIRNLYKLEKFSNAKTAHLLTSQAVWPSIFERQSVPLALAVWDQSTHNAIFVFNQRNKIFNQTHQFIALISRFWKICNIHSPGKDICLLDADSRVFKNQDDRFEFLAKFVLGLRTGKYLDVLENAGKLSSQTFASLIHTTRVIPKIINHLTSDECGFSYVLTGFLTKRLTREAFWCLPINVWLPIQHFFVKILRVSDESINIGNILKLYQAQDGKYESSLKEFVRSFSVQPNTPVHQSDLSIYSPLLHENFDFSPTVEIRQAFAFIGGYAVHNIYIRICSIQKSLSPLLIVNIVYLSTH